MFLIKLVCCLTDFPSDYLQSIKRICMKSQPEVCLTDLHETSVNGVRLAMDLSTKLCHSGDVPYYDHDLD